MTTFDERLRIVKQRIEAAGGSPDLVTVVAVTKTLPASAATLALEHGLLDLGENYAQELVVKAAEVAHSEADSPLANGRVAARWHMIGNVQRNKVKKLAGIVSLWQTVDRLKLGREIAKRDPGASVLVQVNTTNEPSKAGCEPDEVAQLVDELRQADLDVRGLMTVGPTDQTQDPRPAFCMLREMSSKLGLEVLSMGMSGDIEKAVSEGTTMIRVGTALFGPRDRAN